MSDEIYNRAMELFLRARLDRPYSDAVCGLVDPYKDRPIDSENDYLNYLWNYCISVAQLESDAPKDLIKPLASPERDTVLPPERRVYSANRPVTVQSEPQPQLRPQPVSKEDKKQRHGVRRAILAVAVCAAIYLCSISIRDAIHRSNQASSTPLPSTAAAPTPTPTEASLPRPESGHVFYVNPTWSDDSRIAPFSIETIGTDDYYIKLVDVGNLGGEIGGIEFYIRGGDTVDIDVPLGIYQLRYASGSSWYGVDHLFGDRTSYYKADDFFDCCEDDDCMVSGWSVELYLQDNGNLKTEEISPLEF